jgi:hypothetical protein
VLVVSPASATAAFRVARRVLLRTGALLADTAALPARVLGIVELGEVLLAQAEMALIAVDEVTKGAGVALDRADTALDHAVVTLTQARLALEDSERVNIRAGALLADTERIIAGAAITTATVGALTDTAAGLLDELTPLVNTGAPLAQRFLDEVSEAEVEAAVALFSELPGLVRRLREDVFPVLATMDRVGSDISTLLELTRDVQLAILGIPGIGFFKKRGAEVEEDEVQHAPAAGS